MTDRKFLTISALSLSLVLGAPTMAAADFWSLDTLKFWKRDKDQPQEPAAPPPVQPGTAVQPDATVQPAPLDPAAPAVESGPIPPADIPQGNAEGTPQTAPEGTAPVPTLTLAGEFQGIWGLSEDVCSRTKQLGDIVDDQALAIQGNRVFFSDSQCRVLQAEGDYAAGQKAQIRCVDIDNQRYETEVLIRPIGAKQLEISAGTQSSLQYAYCAPVTGQQPAENSELDKPAVPEPGADQNDLIKQ